MTTIQKKIKNNSKILLVLFITNILFFAGCKKTDSGSIATNWDIKKKEIADKVKIDIANLKAILPYTISRVVDGDISFDNQKIFKYYNINQSSLNKISTFSKPKNTNDIIANIKAKQLSSLTPVGEDPSGPPTEDPLAALLGEAYRQQYMIATQEFTELSSYIESLNGIASDMLNSLYVTQDEKVLMYSEIEFLKQYATDLETNQDYWIDLYAPLEPERLVTNSLVKNNVIMASNFNGLNGRTIMGPPHRPGKVVRRGCKIDTRAVLIGSVVSGFWGAVAAAKVGATVGTVAVPGIGTVTGAASGFMAGFAAGFTAGVVTGVIGSLLYTCGR